MSWVCRVGGAAPLGAVIVGDSPALAVTAGRPLEVVSATVSFPPHAERDVIARAITAAIAKFLSFDFISQIYQLCGYNPSRLIMDLASAVCASILATSPFLEIQPLKLLINGLGVRIHFLVN
jgi:hypothetical protein